jgi:hypothetical protein
MLKNFLVWTFWILALIAERKVLCCKYYQNSFLTMFLLLNAKAGRLLFSVKKREYMTNKE